MTRTIKALILLGMLHLAACKNDNIASICSGVNKISSCCNKIKMATAKEALLEDEEAIVYPAKNASTPLPVYTWDTKQVLW